MMTRQDFVLIASVLHSLRDEDHTFVVWMDVVQAFGRKLATTNPLFDLEQFVAACAGQKGTS